MKEYQHELGTIYVPSRGDSLAGLFHLAEHAEWFAADTETTELNQYSATFKVRLVQLGTGTEAWVLNPLFPRHKAAIKKLLETGPVTWWHNEIFDLIGLEVSLGLDFNKMAARARDTGIDSRLLDPRGRDKGGIGHKLEELAPHYLGTGSKKSTKTLLHEAMKAHGSKIKIAEVFKECPIDLPEYEIYAGSDVHIASRLAAKLHPMVEASPALRRLHQIEHPLAIRIAMMQRIGTLFDAAWAEEAEAHFDELRDAAENKLVEEWGVKQTTKWAHTNAADLKLVFANLGAKFEKRTKPSKTYPDGQLSLDSEVLKEFAQSAGDVGRLAVDVLTAKRNEHYGGYVRNMRSSLGTDGRTHPTTNPMGASTARMSITNPPLQQLPRSDVYVRGCLLADEDEAIITADFAQIEFRVGAAASRDPVMISRIINGEDLHAVTATALFGPDFNKNQRQASKPIGFGRLYMGGPPGIRQAMVQGDTTGYVPPLTDIRRAIKAFDGDYRAYVRWAKRLIAKVEADHGHLTTIIGRPLRVYKAYAAPNYAIQSAARDVFAAGITKLHKAGLGDRLRLVVHDEMVLSCRPEDAVEVQREVEKAMNTVLLGVPITTESEVKGIRWQK